MGIFLLFPLSILHFSESQLLSTRIILTIRCPDGDVPGESPQEMSDRVDRVIAKIRKLHQQVSPAPYHLSTQANSFEAEDDCATESAKIECDVMIFSHGHFTRCFIARWCDFPISAGYHFSADPGCVSGFEIDKFWILVLMSSLPFLDINTTPLKSLVSRPSTPEIELIGSTTGIELVYRGGYAAQVMVYRQPYLPLAPLCIDCHLRLCISVSAVAIVEQVESTDGCQIYDL